MGVHIWDFGDRTSAANVPSRISLIQWVRLLTSDEKLDAKEDLRSVA